MFIGLMLAAAAATPVPSDLVGSWKCHGRFVRSGQPLSATIDISPGGVVGSLTVDHRDVSPGRYRSTEIWWLDKDDARAAIVDTSGMRWFDGKVSEGGVTFTRSEGTTPLERFSYRLTPGGLAVDWSHRGNAGRLELGDTLACVRS